MKKGLLKIVMGLVLVGVMVLGNSTMSVEASVTTTTTTLTGDATISKPMFPVYDDERADLFDLANTLYEQRGGIQIIWLEDQFDPFADEF